MKHDAKTGSPPRAAFAALTASLVLLGAAPMLAQEQSRGPDFAVSPDELPAASTPYSPFVGSPPASPGDGPA